MQSIDQMEKGKSTHQIQSTYLDTTSEANESTSLLPKPKLSPRSAYRSGNVDASKDAHVRKLRGEKNEELGSEPHGGHAG